MKVRVIRDHLGASGVAPKGSVLDVSELRARELEIRGLAVPLVDRKRVDAMKGAASEGAARPILTLPPGGQTGVEKPALSSPAAPARQKRRYTKRKKRRG